LLQKCRCEMESQFIVGAETRCGHAFEIHHVAGENQQDLQS
jgi:hypothetical protein